MFKNTKITILIASAAVILLALVFGVFYYNSLFSAPQNQAESERFVVPIDQKTQDTVQKLFDQGFIKNKWAFSYALKGKEIEPGGYKISKSVNAWYMVKAFGEPYMKWIVIPEGLRKEQIGELIGDALGWNEQQREDWATKYTSMAYEQLEGIYFPDTYLLPKDETVLQISDRLRAKFNEKFKPYANKFVEANIKWTTALTLASIVQREAAGKSDMPLVAGILWNRLEKKMKLEADDTIQYIRDDIIHYGEARYNSQPKNYTSAGDWWKPIKVSDKQIESPYNTYRNKGLPPHPICNPGLDAIDAVLNSAETDCLYYLHDSSGQIHSAKTYEEHQKNIEKFLK